MAETIVSIDDREPRISPAEDTSRCVLIPEILGSKEVVIFNFCMERIRRNIVNSLSTIEIVHESVSFHSGGLP